jgi:hypothetical protein
MQNMDREMVGFVSADLEGSDCSLTEALFQNFAEGTEENHEHIKIADKQARI